MIIAILCLHKAHADMAMQEFFNNNRASVTELNRSRMLVRTGPVSCLFVYREEQVRGMRLLSVMVDECRNQDLVHAALTRVRPAPSSPPR